MYVVHYTFQHFSIITKLSYDVIQYYNNIISPIGTNARIKEMYKNEQYKRRSRVNRRKTRETHRGAQKDGALDGLLEIHVTAAPL